MIDRELVLRKMARIAADLATLENLADKLQSATKDIPEYLSHVRRYLDRLESDG